MDKHIDGKRSSKTNKACSDVQSKLYVFIEYLKSFDRLTKINQLHIQDRNYNIKFFSGIKPMNIICYKRMGH